MPQKNISSYPGKGSQPFELLRMYRNRAGLTQSQVAAALGLKTLRMVQNWEGGYNLPKADNLKKLVEIYTRQQVFLAGQERSEIHQLWNAIKDLYDNQMDSRAPYPILDERWLEALINIASSQTTIDAPPPSLQSESIEAASNLSGSEGLNQATQAIHQISTPPYQIHSPITRHRNEQKLIERVYDFWIKGVLNRSLYQAVLIELGLEEQPAAVANPWEMVIQQSPLAPHLLPSDTHISQVYEATRGELLILGEPGVGKTTLLLELARELLEKARFDTTARLPVVFNLATWANKRQPLADWIASELNQRYQVPKTLAKAWASSDFLILLLDGLDEVAEVHRKACVEAINAYRLEHGTVAMVVCSRTTEYMAQSNRVLLHSAVVIQPLLEQQIEAYLERLGPEMKILKQTLHTQPELRQLASTPLMLNVLILTFAGTVPILEGEDQTQLRQKLLATYVQKMLTRRGVSQKYSLEQTIQWLSWLAGQLHQRSQTIFYLEQLQPNWLPEAASKFRLLYRIIVGSLLGILYGGALGCMLGGSIGAASAALDNFILANVDGVIIGLIFGPVIGMVLGVIISLILYFTGQENWLDVKPAEVVVWSAKNIIQNLIYAWLLGTLGFYLLSYLLNWTYLTLREIVEWESLSLFFHIGQYVLVYGLLGAGLYFILGKFDKTSSDMFWWQRVLAGLQLGLCISIAGLFLGGHIHSPLDFGKLIQLQIGGIPGVLLHGALNGLMGGIIYGILSGFSSSEMDNQSRTKPNHGIHQSLRNGLQVGLFFWLSFWLSFWWLGWLSLKVVFGLCWGLSLGLALGLLYGGAAAIKHFILRLLLWRNGSISFDYVKFLDYSTERILLRKVGGGYIFIHAMFLEYFVSVLSQTDPQAPVQKKG